MKKLSVKQRAFQNRRKESLNKRRLQSKAKRKQAKLQQIAGEEEA